MSTAHEALVAHRGRRVRTFEVTPDLILDLLKVGAEGVVVGDNRIMFESEPIPDEALVLRVGLNERNNLVMLLVHDSFELIRESEPIPELRTTYRAEPVNGKQGNGGTTL